MVYLCYVTLDYITLHYITLHYINDLDLLERDSSYQSAIIKCFYSAFNLSSLSRMLHGTGVGLDFSSASAVVFAELPEEVALVRQAEDRAHRKGQTMPVNVYFLIARSTIDERRCVSPNSLTRRDSSHPYDVVGD